MKLTDEQINKITIDLTDNILGLLMEKTINKVTYDVYKSKIHKLILTYLKSNS